MSIASLLHYSVNWARRWYRNIYKSVIALGRSPSKTAEECGRAIGWAIEPNGAISEHRVHPYTIATSIHEYALGEGTADKTFTVHVDCDSTRGLILYGVHNCTSSLLHATEYHDVSYDWKHEV